MKGRGYTEEKERCEEDNEIKFKRKILGRKKRGKENNR
jgi:hypothetical protein